MWDLGLSNGVFWEISSNMIVFFTCGESREKCHFFYFISKFCDGIGNLTANDIENVKKNKPNTRQKFRGDFVEGNYRILFSLRSETFLA